jgi:hypothetical protein
MTEIDGEILSKITQIRGFEKGIRRFLDSGDVGIVLLRDMMKELDEMSIHTNNNEVLDEIRKLQSDMRGYKRIIRGEEKTEEDEEIIKIQSKLSMCGIKIKLIRDDKGVLHLKNLQSVDKIVFDIGLVNNGKVRVSRYNFGDKNVKLDITNLDFELQTNFEYRSIFRGIVRAIYR